MQNKSGVFCNFVAQNDSDGQFWFEKDVEWKFSNEDSVTEKRFESSRIYSFDFPLLLALGQQ